MDDEFKWWNGFAFDGLGFGQEAKMAVAVKDIIGRIAGNDFFDEPLTISNGPEKLERNKAGGEGTQCVIEGLRKICDAIDEIMDVGFDGGIGFARENREWTIDDCGTAGGQSRGDDGIGGFHFTVDIYSFGGSVTGKNVVGIFEDVSNDAFEEVGSTRGGVEFGDEVVARRRKERFHFR